MESISEVKNEIKEKVIANYVAALDDCMSFNELEKPTLKIITKLT